MRYIKLYQYWYIIILYNKWYDMLQYKIYNDAYNMLQIL